MLKLFLQHLVYICLEYFTVHISTYRPTITLRIVYKYYANTLHIVYK